MTSSITIPAPVAAPPRARSSAAVWVGGIVALVGVTLAIASGAVLVLFGEDSTLSSDPHSLSTMTAALVSGTAAIEDTADTADVVGNPRIKIAAEADGERGVFIGIGPAADVERYLAAAPIAEVTDLDLNPWRLERRTRRGTMAPTPPAREDFWVAQSSGENKAAIDWKVRDGSYRAVVMNADGSRDVATHGTFGVKIPHISPIALVLLIGGLGLTVGGIAGGVIGARRLRTR
jgi:hypothetical protein